MKKILTIILFAFTLNAGAQNIWRAPSVFEQPVNFKAAISQTSGTDSLGITTVGANTTLNHGNGCLVINNTKAIMGLFDSTDYRISAGANDIQLQQGNTDSLLVTFSGDTAHLNATVAAWDFSPPLNSSSVTGFWKTTGNAGTTADTNFIGTTDNVDLYIKRNGLVAAAFLTGGGFNFGDLPGLGEKQKITCINGVISAQMRRRFEVLDTTTAVLFKVDKAQSRIQLGLNTLPLTDTGYSIGSSSFRFKELRALRGYFDGAVTIADGTQGDGKVLTSDANGLASWQPASATPLDSATIYALTPTLGTQYYCTDCTGNGITGRIVAYIGAAWRRLLFED